MYKAITLFALLFSFTSCTPQTQQLAISTGTKAVIQCLDQVVILGLNNEGLTACLQVSSVTITNAVLAEVNSILTSWSDTKIQNLADNIGVQSHQNLSRSFNRWQALNGIIHTLSLKNTTSAILSY